MKIYHLNATALLLIAVFVFSSCSGFQEPAEEVIEADGPPPSLIPLPDSLSWGDHMYRVPQTNSICFTEGGGRTAEWLEELLENSGRESEVSQGKECGNWNIIKNTELKEELGEEGYILEIDNNGVRLESATEAGLFYAVQSLRQVFPAEIESSLDQDELLLRQVHIQDQPEFGWRGTMVDVARSFFGLEYLKKHVDRMAMYKMNRLHLHLTDDQGWRIEIKGKPKLTEVGAKGSVKNGNSGFLTQEEYRELQEYALARNIIIVPEIDMPGHIYSALVAYPELNCPEYSNLTPARATPPELYSEYRVGWSKLCLENDEIYEFVSEVIGEVAEMTRGPWIHIGGDEIKDPRYKEFVVKADSIVQDFGKTTIGWEEVTQAEVSSSLISQRWRGTVESVVDVKVIQSLCSQFYFDHANIPGQENTNNWCKESGVSIEEAYNYRNEDPNVIGVEAPVWTEFVINEEMLDDRFWPRTIAVAEVGWTPEEGRDFEDFKTRLAEHGDRLSDLGIHYFRTPGVNWGTKEISEDRETLFSGFMPESK